MSGMYLGSTISLISKSDIRYVGVLHSINQAESTVSLGQVKSHGTEGRRSGLDEIPANDKIFEYIVFRGSDIKDLHVVTAPVQAQSQVPNDPAILTTQPPPSEQGQPSYFNNSNLPLPHNTMSQPYLPPGMNNYMLQQAQQQQAMFFQQQQQNFWQQQQQQQHSNNAVPAFSAQQTLPTQNASQQQAPNSTSPTSTPIKTENLEEGSTEKLNNDLMKLNLNSSSKKSTTGSTFVTENNLVVKKEKKNVESTTNPRSASPAYKNVTAEDSFGQSGIDNEKPPAEKRGLYEKQNLSAAESLPASKTPKHQHRQRQNGHHEQGQMNNYRGNNRKSGIHQNGDYENNNFRGGRGRGRGNYANASRGNNVSKITVPDSDFDFESANAKFEKNKLNENEPSEDDNEHHEADSPKEMYYEKSSFFDNISCEAKEKAEGGNNRNSRVKQFEERRLNLETFGQTGARRGGYNRGRGRGRGGNYKNNSNYVSGRGNSNYRGNNYRHNYNNYRNDNDGIPRQQNNVVSNETS